MAGPKEPSRKVKVEPGENLWEAMARELASNPDSPASLQIMSAVNNAMRPRNAAADQLIEALALPIEASLSPVARAGVAAAIAHWSGMQSHNRPVCP